MLTKIVSDYYADVVSLGRAFQTRGPATVKDLLLTVESLTVVHNEVAHHIHMTTLQNMDRFK